MNVVKELIVIETIFGLIWYFMYSSFLIKHIILFGDLGISDLNSNILSQFFNVAPNYSNTLFIFIYHYDKNFLPSFWNYYLLFIPFLTPLGFYYLLYSMDFKSYTRIIATIFYSLNPLTILFGISGLEYTGIFLFFPLILAFMIKYHEDNNIQNLINSVVLIFLLFIFLGIDYLKFIIFIILSIIALDIFFSGRKKILEKFRHYILWLTLIIILTLPFIVSLLYSLNVFSHASITGSSTVSNLVGITKFEYSASNLEVNLYALPYVANQLTEIKYENSWYGAFYLFLIIFSLISIFKYKGKHKNVYYTLFVVLTFLILFQYGVFNGTLIYLYEEFPTINVYNYPLFFYISQLLIYAMFFAISLECFGNHLNYIISTKFKKFRKTLIPILAVVFIVIILISSMPVIEYEHKTNPSSAKADEIPNYVLNLTQQLKPYSNSRVMILPDNTSSLNYLYMSISYYDAYGFPYGYQNFLSEFPNLTEFQLIGNAFQNDEPLKAGTLLESQDIMAVVVLHTLSNKTIIFHGTEINGGGASFDNIMNKTLMYSLLTWDKNYAIYTFNASKSLNLIKNAPFNKFSEITYEPIKAINNMAIVTSKLSFEEYPINITTSYENKSMTYDQYIKISRDDFKAINKNFSNILFYYSNNTEIPAWIENINNNSAVLYLKIIEEINQTVYMRIYPNNVNMMFSNGYLGEAPQISGSGTNILPSYIKYSTVFIGVYGYGYDGNIFTYNISFNPSLFNNYENSNLSNIAFYTYNGELLDASIHGNPTNTSSSAIATISFPNGVNYFMMDKTNNGAGYNVFYLGFAQKNEDLNALKSDITYNLSSSNTAINIGYLPYAVRDYGIYNEYNNGKNVFPYYNDYSNVSFGNDWEFDIFVNGYGFIGSQDYTPMAYFNYYLTTISPNEEGISYSYIFGGETASPIYISNNTDSSLMGANTNGVTGGGINETLQQHSTDIGFGSNNTYLGIYYNYNDTSSYAYKTLYQQSEINEFAYYGIYYNNQLNFEISNNNVLTYNYGNGSKLNLMISNIGGGSMNTLYSLVIDKPNDNIMPNITIGNPEVFQAYFNNQKIENPAYSNGTIEFTVFIINNEYNNTQWKINNKTIFGNTILYMFNKSGTYNLTIFNGNNRYNFTEKILSKPEAIKIKTLNYNGAGNHLINLDDIKSNNIYIWYVNGKYINDNSPNLTYDFKYAGTYSLKVFTVNGFGNYSESFIVNIKNKNIVTVNDVGLFIYNIFAPVLGILYIVSNKFRTLLNYKVNIFIKYFYTIFKSNN